MKKKLRKKRLPLNENPNTATSDYKDPTGSRSQSGTPKKSGYDEKQPHSKTS